MSCNCWYQVLVLASWILPPSRDFLAIPSPGFTENGAINKKHPVSSRFVAKNTLMRGQSRMARLITTNGKATSATTTQYKIVVKKCFSKCTSCENLLKTNRGS